EKDQAYAKQTLLNWHHEFYEHHYKVELKPGESQSKDRKARELANRDKIVVHSAGLFRNSILSYHCSKGEIFCFAERKSDGYKAVAVLPELEYDKREFSYVIDLSKFEEAPFEIQKGYNFLRFVGEIPLTGNLKTNKEWNDDLLSYLK